VLHGPLQRTDPYRLKAQGYLYSKTSEEAAEKRAEALTNRDEGFFFDAETLTTSTYRDRR